MPSDLYSDPAAVSVSLSAETALLEARLRMLREAITAVDTRIDAVSESLRRMQRSSSTRDANEGSGVSPARARKVVPPHAEAPRGPTAG